MIFGRFIARRMMSMQVHAMIFLILQPPTPEILNALIIMHAEVHGTCKGILWMRKAVEVRKEA